MKWLFLFLTFIFSASIVDAQSADWRYMVVENRGDTLPDMLDIPSEFSIRYDAESGLVLQGDSLRVLFGAGDEGRILFRKNLTLDVRLEPPHDSYRVSNIPVSVRSASDGVPVFLLTDSAGVAHLPDLPFDDYTIDIAAERFGLAAPPYTRHHKPDNEACIQLHEKPVAPYSLASETVFNFENDIFESSMKWNDDAWGQLLPYNYIVRVDGVDAVKSVSSEATVPIDKAGKHEISVIGVTPLGALSDATPIQLDLIYPESNFTLNLTTGMSGNYPAGGIGISLIDPAEGVEITSVAYADEDGLVLFHGIPPGDYQIRIEEGIPFENRTVEKVCHEYKDDDSVYLTELVGLPRNLSYQIQMGPDDLYDLTFTWESPEANDWHVDGYLYVFMQGDRFIGETSERNFIIEGLSEGSYKFTIYSLTPYDNLSEDMIVEIDLNPATADVRDSVADAEGKYLYFDINGRPIGGQPSSPGIYLRSDGVSTEKIVVK